MTLYGRETSILSPVNKVVSWQVESRVVWRIHTPKQPAGLELWLNIHGSWDPPLQANWLHVPDPTNAGVLLQGHLRPDVAGTSIPQGREGLI